LLRKATAEKQIQPRFTPESSLPPGFVAALENVTAIRARCVTGHILKHGFIATEDLKNTYGYNHPPMLQIAPEIFIAFGTHGEGRVH
jgi:hypothetical protein